MNPCPCGYHDDPEKECKCTANEVFRYQKKISGPLLDRIDMQITLPRLSIEDLRKKGADSKGAEEIRAGVSRAREAQTKRFAARKGRKKIMTNAELSSKECDEVIALTSAAEKFVETIIGRSFVSPRGYYRILKTARTIADIEGSETVGDAHMQEAFSYRVRDAGVEK